MTNYNELKPGDRIQLLRVPQIDLDQREREVRDGREDAGWTADTIERVIQQNPVVTIERIDADGFPWFECVLPSENGPQEHSIAIMENESWRLAP